MCGIAGYIGPKVIGQDAINKTLGVMKNRGPDHQKAICFFDKAKQIHLLHSRLSIIDLDPRSNQPFERRGVWLIFNGEIYNYLEVRSELEGLGVVFHTSSDTEVLVEAYLQWGEECVQKFEGMWAFVIYDTRLHKLFLSRADLPRNHFIFLKVMVGYILALRLSSLLHSRQSSLRLMNSMFYGIWLTDISPFTNSQRHTFRESVSLSLQ